MAKQRETLKQTSGNACLATLVITVVATLGLTAIGVRPVDLTVNHRPPVPAQPTSARELLSYPGGLKYYFENSFATRDVCVELQGRLLSNVFGSSASTKVVLGDGGWLFLDNEGALDQYKRSTELGASTLEQWNTVLSQWRDAASDQGAQFALVIAPNKSSIYAGNVPATIQVGPAPSNAAQILDSTGSKIPAIFPFADLATAGSAARTYHLTDTHWNEWGAWVATKAMLRRLAELRGLEIKPPEVSVDWSKGRGGDLARLTGLSRVQPEEIAHVTLQPSRIVTRRSGKPLPRHGLDGGSEPMFDEHHRLYTQCPNGEFQSAIVHVDSFGEVMIPWIAYHFQRCVFVRDFHYDRALVEQEKPDFVIAEIVERRLTSAVEKALPAPATASQASHTR